MTKMIDLSGAGVSNQIMAPLKKGLALLALVPGVIVIVACYSFESIKRPSGATRTSLNVENHFVLNRLAHGITIPFLGAIFSARLPKESGDPFVFDSGDDRSRLLFHNVTGFECITLQTRSKQAFINGCQFHTPQAIFTADLRGCATSPRYSIHPDGEPKGSLQIRRQSRQ